MRAVVTAGGTSEPIDDVRVITNFSTGRFGAAIANALARRGHEVVLLAGKALASHPEWVDPGVRVVPFGSFADLDLALQEETRRPPDVLFMAAAVSDYTPVRAPGKIRSDQDELTIVLRRNPKLIGTLRDRCPDALLIGFKLLSGVTEDELVRVARAQVEANRLDACVANDLQRLGAEHPIVWVDAGGIERRTGTKEAVASWLADRVEALPVTLDGLDERQADALITSLAAGRVVARPSAVWQEHGWRVVGAAGERVVLSAPALEGRLDAASVCLLDPAGRVLIGRRRTPPWEGYWAFPGGRRQPGEDLLDTALRELAEETGLRIPRSAPLRERRVLVGTDPGFVVTNFVLRVAEAEQPVPTRELEARWVDLREVGSLRPMAGGTRLVLAGLEAPR